MNTLESINIIGLTGSSGAGKSTVSSMFSECGFEVIDADKIARNVASYEPFLNEVKKHFPDCVSDSGLDRRKTASIVFNDKDKLKLYTEIIYPYITTDVFSAVLELKKKGSRYILLDAPTLFESGLDDICRAVVSVTAPYNVKIERIMKRDGISEELARSRLGSQHDEQWFIQNSDYHISNCKDLSSLREDVLSVIKQIKERFDV